MTQRNFDTECWTSDAWFQSLPRDGKLLFIYAWTNSHCNPAGLYAITVPTIAFEAGFTPEEVRELLPSLAPHVVYYPEHTLLWVRAFLRRQSRSSKFLTAAAHALASIPRHIVAEYLHYNDSLSIPYRYSPHEPEPKPEPKPRAQSLSTPQPPHDAAAGSAAAPPRESPKAETVVPQEAVLTAEQEAVLQRAVQLFGENVSPTGPPSLAFEEMREYVLSGAQVGDFEYAWKAAAGKAQGSRLTWAYPRKVLERLESEGWPAEREKAKSGPGPPERSTADYTGGRYGHVVVTTDDEAETRLARIRSFTKTKEAT